MISYPVVQSIKGRTPYDPFVESNKKVATNETVGRQDK